MKKSVFVFGLAVAFAAGIAHAADKTSVERGRTLYTTVGCVQCHGTHGQGSNAGVRLAPDSLPAEAIAQFIRNTDTNAPPYAAMPTYSEEVLPDQDVADIAAYLASIPPPKSPDKIPALKDLKP